MFVAAEHRAQQRITRHGRSDLVFGQYRNEPRPPQPHVRFHPQQIVRETGVGTRRGRLDHPRSVLRHPVASFRPVEVAPFLRVQRVHDIFGAEAQTERFLRRIDGENSVFDLFAPEKLLSVKILHATKGADKLTDSGVTDILKIRLAFVEGFGLAHLEETHFEVLYSPIFQPYRTKIMRKRAKVFPFEPIYYALVRDNRTEKKINWGFFERERITS
mmetsp:Transcript_20160/g.45690  ORF Transcript_20160/g.45690 Transcript_20160/m.45690 type:complete len:216 (+) Transcript_20160:2370-3017(+)